MTITTLAATLTEAGAASTSIAATKPTLTADLDVVLVASYTANAAPTSVPAGWTLIPSSSVTLSTWCSAGYYRVVRGSDVAAEPGTYTWGFASSRCTVIIRPYYGVNTGAPFDQTAATTNSNSNATTVAIGAVVAPTDGTMLISAVGQDSATGTLTPPGTMTSVTTSTGTGKVANYAEETLTTGGSSGTRTWTFNSSVLAHGGWLAALRPATGIRHIQAIGTNSSKTTGTTLAVTATPGTQPAVGDLIVVSCARDDIASDPLTGDSISDGHGNTYTRITKAGASGTDVTAKNSVNVIIFWCRLTVAWSGTTTVTWTHPSVDARGMQVEHFQPDSGYTITVNGTPASTSGFGSFGLATNPEPAPAGDLVFGVAGMENDTSVVLTGDSDTLGGSWSTITAFAGTTGGTANTNIAVATQHKLITAPSAQAWQPSIGTSSNYATVLIHFHQYAAGGPYLVGVGAQVASSTGNVTPLLPAAATTNDLLVLVVGGRPSSNAADGVTVAAGADGWAQHGSTSYVAVAATDDLSVQVWWKFHDGSETDPTVSVNTVLAAAAAIDRGYSAQIAAFRNVDSANPFDVTPVTSNTGAAAATFTPTGVTTAINGALALSLVASADDNAVNFNTSQSFVMAFGGTEYDTTTGSDHSVALGWKIISAASAVTEPTWNQSVNGNDQWVGLSTALRPPTASADVASGSGSAFDVSTTTAVPAPAGTASATGIAYDATVTTSTAGTDANAGTATGTGTANNATTTSAAAPTGGSAAGTGTANAPTLTILSASAAGVATAAGSAFDAAATTSVLAAAGTGTATGTANTPSTSASQPAGAASATGTANTPTITAAGSAAAGTATGTGAAYDVSSDASAAAGSAVGTGAAYNASTTASVAASAGLASAVGTANDASATSDVVAPAGSATGSGTANPATGTGAASVAAGTASATGSAFDAAASTAAVANAGTASASGAADAPTITIDIHAGLSSGIGTAYPSTIATVSNAAAGIGLGAGVAYDPAVADSANAGLASAAGSAYAPAATVDTSAGLATSNGAGFDAVAFTVNGSDPIAYTYLILGPSATWARLTRTDTTADLNCTSTLVEMETL